MLLLLVVLWLLGVLARDDPQKDSRYVIKHIRSCPDVGYFFRRESSPNALDALCHLCFCQDDGTAVCWPRENRRCDAAHYQHGVGKRDARVRRSPIGLSDIFFRDAARDLFNKQMPETCKPYESTFSEGCPPADWCTGCTVCDCDANGRWVCHILSFCPDSKHSWDYAHKLRDSFKSKNCSLCTVEYFFAEKDKNKLKTSKKRLRDGSAPKRTTVTTSKSVTPNNKNIKNHPKRTPTPTAPKKPAVNKKQVKNNGKILQKEKQSNGHTKQVRKWTPKANNTIEKRSSASPKPLIINKEVPKTPILVNVPKIAKLEGKNAELFTQEVYKKVVLAVEKLLEKRIAAVPKPAKTTGTRSRKMVKRSTKNLKNIKNAKKKVDGQFKPVATKRKYTKPIRPKNNKQHFKKKSPVKSNKKVGNGKRIKRHVSENNTSEKLMIEYSTYNNTDFTVTILPYETSSGVEKTVANVTGTSNYYKYSMITPSLSTASVNSEEYQIVNAVEKNKTTDFNKTDMHQKTDKEKHFDEIQADVLNNTTSVKNNTINEKPKLSFENVSSDLNDLKFKDWPQIKLLKHSLMSAKQVGILVDRNNTSNFSKVYDDSVMNQPKFKVKDIARILSPTTRKYNRSKVINTLSCNTLHSKKRAPESFRERFHHKIDDLQSILKRLLSEFRKTNNTNVKPKPRRFSVIKYLKRFFTKPLKKYKGKGKNGSKYQTELNDHIVNTICESFRDCDMRQKYNIKLRSKLRELNNESYVIIRTIKIIKGLLRLLDIPSQIIIDGDTKLNRPKDKSNFKEDIRKLYSVLKDKYKNNNTPLTSTQMTQIKYIKNNTELFVQSVSRFANILNEIITILTKKQNIEDKSKLPFKTAKRSFDNIRKLENDTDGDFKRLKGLLVKYNLIQNTFVRKMYNLLSKFEKVQENSTRPMKMNKENKETTATIERFSRNIINNLRKLKNLAKMLNSRRKKRNAMRDDDAMEYLLTLMEFLLKQNYPLDAAPVNDGIDLLIEAIKSAPDIKPIKKKVLQLPVNIRISRTTEPIPYGMSKLDTYSDSRKDSDRSVYNDTISDTKEHSSDQEKESEDFKYQPGKNIFDSGTAGNTEVYYEKAEPSATPNKLKDTTVIPGAYGIFGNVDITTEYNNFKKLESIAKESNKNFELFNSDLDDDEVEVSSTTVMSNPETETDNAVTVTIPLETTEGNTDDRSKQYNVNSADVSGNSVGDKRVILDWLDEGYEDNKEVRQTKNETIAHTLAPVLTTTKPVHVDNVSALTKEAMDEEEKKRMTKINVHDVMFKKQMDLLNSLDYGTERSEADDTESKEGDERYSGDVFPSYFA